MELIDVYGSRWLLCLTSHLKFTVATHRLFMTNYFLTCVDDCQLRSIYLPSYFHLYHHKFITSKIRSPDDFIPERWLDSDADAETLKEFFFPFSAGKRSCVGQNLAQLELMLFLASFFYFYDFELVSEVTELLHLTLKPQNAHFKVTNRKL